MHSLVSSDFGDTVTACQWLVAGDWFSFADTALWLVKTLLSDWCHVVLSPHSQPSQWSPGLGWAVLTLSGPVSGHAWWQWAVATLSLIRLRSERLLTSLAYNTALDIINLTLPFYITRETVQFFVSKVVHLLCIGKPSGFFWLKQVLNTNF